MATLKIPSKTLQDNFNLQDFQNDFLALDEQATQMKSILDTWEQFKANGGEIGGGINFNGEDARKLKKAKQKIGTQSVTFGEEIKNSNGNFSHTLYCSDSDTEDINRVGVSLVRQHGATANAWFRPEQGDTISLGSTGFPFKDIYLNGISKNTNGYTKLLNGIIMQWGRINTGAVSSTQANTVTYPIAFPTQTNVAIITHDTGCTSYGAVKTTDYSTVGFKAYVTGSDSTSSIRWIAIGY